MLVVRLQMLYGALLPNVLPKEHIGVSLTLEAFAERLDGVLRREKSLQVGLRSTVLLFLISRQYLYVVLSQVVETL